MPSHCWYSTRSAHYSCTRCNACNSGCHSIRKRFRMSVPTRHSDRMTWKTYAIALLVFNALGALFVYAVQRLQFWLPLNPQAFPNVSPDSSFRSDDLENLCHRTAGIQRARRIIRVRGATPAILAATQSASVSECQSRLVIQIG